jgi:hypothetical protein
MALNVARGAGADRGTDQEMTDWVRERETVLRVFTEMLSQATGDGSIKRQRGEKLPWWKDDSHEAALYRHLEKYESGERYAEDSGVHHLISLGWRSLAAAYQELYGKVEPE